MILQDAIRVYHDLLTPALAADTQGRLDQQQERHHLSFGDRPMCTVLRPRFLTSNQYRFLEQRVGLLLSAFARVQRHALAVPSFRQQFGLRDWEEELLQIYEGYDCAYPTSRLDSFFVSEDELCFTEYNSETPAGAAYNDVLSEVFLGLPIMREFRRRYRVLPLPARPGVLDALLTSYLEWSGRRELPTIAILDWKEVPTYTEFLLFQEYFQNRGLHCVIADPREVEFVDGQLRAGDVKIDLIYKRVLISELWERGGHNHPVLQALRARAVCMVNGFSCKMLYKKASFAVMTDEENAGLFTDEERKVIASHIPWTRRVSDRKTVHAGRTVDLLKHVRDHRELFVLKPNDDYGGKGIVLGWTVSQGEWEQAIQVALADPYVVQQRINVPSEPFPSLVDGTLHVVDRMLDTNPYACHGQFMDGCLTRISTAALLNVTAGGGSTVPTFVIGTR
ncbi:hypothetical protein BH10PLA2_BH10PLA2_20070 [soil metagenome]